MIWMILKKEVEGADTMMGLSVWSAWSIIIFLLIGFFLYDMLRRAKEKKIIKAYKEITDSKGRKTFSELMVIGEFKSEVFNPVKRCFEFRMRQNFSYFNLNSNYTMAQLMNVHKIERNYLIVYSLQCYVYEKKLAQKDYYERELGWTIQAYFYRFFSFCFNMSSSGIILSPLIIGLLFLYSFPEISYAFILGCLVGYIISFINYLLSKSKKIDKALLKKKKELITTETYISPLESEEEIQDEYRIWGTQQKLVDTKDAAREYEKIILSDGVEKDSEEKGKPIEFKTIIGFDELYRLQQDPLIQIVKLKTVGVVRRKRTNQEMLNLRRSYLARNKAFAEDNFRLKSENERIQNEYRQLQEQLMKVEETKDKGLKEFGLQMIKHKRNERTTLRSIYEEIKGSEFISENFDATHERVMRKLNLENQLTLADQMTSIVKLLRELLIEISKKSNIDVDRISRLLTIKYGDGNGENRKTE